MARQHDTTRAPVLRDDTGARTPAGWVLLAVSVWTTVTLLVGAVVAVLGRADVAASIVVAAMGLAAVASAAAGAARAMTLALLPLGAIAWGQSGSFMVGFAAVTAVAVLAGAATFIPVRGAAPARVDARAEGE